MLTELLLIAAARAQHVDECIRPALAANQIVICDRFIDATVAYQGYRGGIDLDLIHQLNRVATGGLTPDITFILDLPPEIGLQRQQHGETHQDRLDKEPLELHRKVREGYLSAAEADPHRVKLIDATQSPDAVHDAILTEYQKYFYQSKTPLGTENAESNHWTPTNCRTTPAYRGIGSDRRGIPFRRTDRRRKREGRALFRAAHLLPARHGATHSVRNVSRL